jgi:hypothetical protein
MTGQPASPPEEGTGDVAVQERRQRFSIVWIIPIIVVLAAAGLPKGRSPRRARPSPSTSRPWRAWRRARPKSSYDFTRIQNAFESKRTASNPIPSRLYRTGLRGMTFRLIWDNKIPCC